MTLMVAVTHWQAPSRSSVTPAGPCLWLRLRLFAVTAAQGRRPGPGRTGRQAAGSGDLIELLSGHGVAS